MRKRFPEVDETGTVTAIHNVETAGSKGAAAAQPRIPINKARPQNTIRAGHAANIGDRWDEERGIFLRPLPKRQP